MRLQCRKARDEDFPPVSRMLELYQYELSDIWDQELDEQGTFGYDLSRHREGTRFFAHVALAEDHYAGFALVAPAMVTQRDGFWMEQFFVLKKYRKSGIGTTLAHHVIQNHPGPWEVGQMPQNLPAQAFWRKVIAKITEDSYIEVHVQEGHWQGVVQRFRYGAATQGNADQGPL